jgi:hypothetical protein
MSFWFLVSTEFIQSFCINLQCIIFFKNTRGVAKEELWKKFKYFHHAKI